MLVVAIEIMIVCLLFVTIFYCIQLHRRLGQIRDEKQGLGAIVEELNKATLRAEGVLGRLQDGAIDAQQTLSQTIAAAEDITVYLNKKIKQTKTPSKNPSKEASETFQMSRNHLNMARQMRKRRPGFSSLENWPENEEEQALKTVSSKR